MYRDAPLEGPACYKHAVAPGVASCERCRRALREQCGEWYRLRWVRYGARQHLGEHAAAVEEATKLMAHDPEDHDYPWWRGMAYEEMGRTDDAIADYRLTLRLLPSADRIPFNLASL